MNTRPTNADPGVAWNWKQEVWRQLVELEDIIDRLALRLGDAVLGERLSEKLFGPHPSRF